MCPSLLRYVMYLCPYIAITGDALVLGLVLVSARKTDTVLILLLQCKYPYCPYPMPPAPAPIPNPPEQVPLTLFPQDVGTLSPANLDGSPYGVYFRPSPSGKSTKWTVSIEGGGWCCELPFISLRVVRRPLHCCAANLIETNSRKPNTAPGSACTQTMRWNAWRGVPPRWVHPKPGERPSPFPPRRTVTTSNSGRWDV